MWLFIRPLDTVCCRDGRPFTAGENDTGHTIFPPMPSTFYGALRTALLSENNKAFDDFQDSSEPYDDLPEVGTPSKLGSLRIAGPCLAEKDEGFGDYQFYFPSPLHFVREKNNEDKFHKLALPDDKCNASEVSDLEQPLFLMQGPEDTIVKSFDGYLNFNGLQTMLRGTDKIKNDEIYKPEQLFKSTHQVGLQRTFGVRTAEEGRLYSIAHFQMENSQSSGFFIKLGTTDENDESVKNLAEKLPEKGFLKLGGEWRGAVYEKTGKKPFKDSHLQQAIELISTKKRFMLWLITPAIFRYGCLP